MKALATSRPGVVSSTRRILPLAAVSLLPLLAPFSGQAAELEPSDGGVNEYYGVASGISGSIAVVGAAANGSGGSVYVYQNLENAEGVFTQQAKLVSTGGLAGEFFGYDLDLDGTMALVGASVGGTGVAYLYRDLDTVSGTVTQNVRLLSSDGASGDQFGASVSLSGSIGLVGANTFDGTFTNQGAAYVFRNLDTATGTVNEQAKLLASDASASQSFGVSNGLSGSIGVVGAIGGTGAAYVYRDLDTVTGTVTENAKLVGSDSISSDLFGYRLSVSDNIALVAASQDDDGANNTGSVYVYRDLDTITGMVTENAKLAASDRASNDYFGYSVSNSGTVGLVGSYLDNNEKGTDAGSAYLYLNLDTASGTVTETVKILASNGAANDNFGYSVSVSGDDFVIGTMRGDSTLANSGNAYTGSVSAITTLDEGSVTRVIDAISFISKDDWVVGRTTDGNTVHLTAGDTANVTAADRAVYIGQQAGSDNNTLIISGVLTSNQVNIGSVLGNEGNSLQLENTATFSATEFRLAPENFLTIEGDYSEASSLLAYLGGSSLQVWTGSLWELVNAGNYDSLVSSSYEGGYTVVQAVPEPGTYVLVALGLGLLVFSRRRRAA